MANWSWSHDVFTTRMTLAITLLRRCTHSRAALLRDATLQRATCNLASDIDEDPRLTRGRRPHCPLVQGALAPRALQTQSSPAHAALGGAGGRMVVMMRALAA